MIAKPEDILEKLPKKTPVWAVGGVSLVVSLTVSFVVLYVTARPEVQQFLTSSQEERRVKTNAELATIASILDLVKTSSLQIANMSAALNSAQEQNFRLSERVATIEKDLALTQGSLSVCEAKLRTCNCKH